MRLVIILSLLLPLCAHAYKFEVSIAGKTVSDPVHETLTSASIDCFLSWKGGDPKPCDLSRADINTSFSNQKIAISDSFNVFTNDLREASSFPDDPGRTEKLHSGIKSLVLDKDKCLKRSWLFWVKDFTKNITGGLFCSSHFGVLQFFHAMASEEMMPFEDGRFLESKQTESYSDTHRKILAWAALNARISVDDSYSILETGYYDYFNKLPNDDLVKPIAKYFAIQERYNYKNKTPFLKSTDSEGRPLYGVSFIFNNECNKLMSYKTCKKVSNRQARIAALGSLFHLIQDSYSASHTLRSTFEQGEPAHARVFCDPIKQYSTYRGQNVDYHASADAGEISFNASCYDQARIVDDPVFAGAKVLWLLSNRDIGPDHSKLINYLRQRVFTSAYLDTQDGPNACAGNFDLQNGSCLSM